MNKNNKYLTLTIKQQQKKRISHICKHTYTISLDNTEFRKHQEAYTVRRGKKKKEEARAHIFIHF